MNRSFPVRPLNLILLVSLPLATALASEGSGGGPKAPAKKCYLIGNSLTWDTVPQWMQGDVQWHVDCGKSLPYIFEHPEKPCVKSSTLLSEALENKQYDIVVVQPHYGSTLAQDAAVISELMQLQPEAEFVIHTGWARSESREAEWAQKERAAGTKMNHSASYFEALVELVEEANPGRALRRTMAMDLLQQVAEDIEGGRAPLAKIEDLYRDDIHMDYITGRYLMHNAMRHALGLERTRRGFPKLKPELVRYFDSVLDRVQETVAGADGKGDPGAD